MKLLKRLAFAAIAIYFAIAAYGRWHKPEPEFYCPCPECLCEHTQTQSAEPDPPSNA